MDTVLLVILVSSIGLTKATWGNPERQVVQRILRDYDEADRYSRPVYNASHAVWVSVGLILNKVVGFEEKKETLTFTAWNRMVTIAPVLVTRDNVAKALAVIAVWQDEYLPWNATTSGVNSIRLPPDRVWTPDVRAYNSLESDHYRPLLVVNADGVVLWVTQNAYSVPCGRTTEPTEWTCYMRISSSVWDGSQLALHSMWHNVDMSSYESHGYVEMLGASALREVTYWPCCVQPYPSVVFKFLIAIKK